MRLISRLFGMLSLFILLIFHLLTLIEYNVRYDEINMIVSSALKTTQYVMQEQIEDNLNETEFRRMDILSNEDYLKEFKKNLMIQVNTNSDYDIHVFGIDYEKGLLDVGVDCNYKALNGEEKTISTRKCSIIEIEDGDENE